MTRGSRKRACVEGKAEDRISDLPACVTDCIFKHLPLKDSAKTSVLSTKWRYTWAMCPNLVLDKLFCETLAGMCQHTFIRTVDKVLLQHVGVIVKFHLDLSGVHLSSDTDIDAWMLYVTRNSVKQLTLVMSNNNTTYTLPSCVFNCPTLTCLKLSDCSVKLPNSFVGFQNLKYLYLIKITIVPISEFCIVKAPVLTGLLLKKCDGAQYLNIVSPLLVHLVVLESRISLNCFTNCKKLEMLVVRRMVDNPKFVERSILEKLLLSLPVLKTLILGSTILELLSAGKVHKELPFTLNLCLDLAFSVDFDRLGQTSYALELMNHAPNFRRLRIFFIIKDNPAGENAEAALEYLSTPACLDRPLNQLKHVEICCFEGSKAEYLFVKQLLARTPSLIRMTIKHRRFLDKRNIITELMHFPRASSKAELICLSYAS